MFKFRSILWLLSLVLILFNIYRAFTEHWDYADPMDFRGLYVQTLLFEEGKPLYSDEIAAEKWQELKEAESFVSSTDLGDKYYSILLYPPQVVVQFNFIKDLTWKQVRIIWWLICFVSFIIILLILYGLTRDPLIIALALAAKASFFALALGQPLLPVTALILLALVLYKQRPWLAGIFLGLALLKFTMVIPIAFWLLFKKHYKTLGAMAATGLALLIPSVLSEPQIIQQFFAKVSDYYELIYTPHPLNIYTFSDSEFVMMVDFYLDQPAQLWSKINLVFQFGISFLMGALFFKKKLSESMLLALLVLCSFVFSYHLSYDALFLLIPLAFIKETKAVYKAGMLWFVMLALPWNSVIKAIHLDESWTILLFNYPILVALAFGTLIFAAFGRRSTHTAP